MTLELIAAAVVAAIAAIFTAFRAGRKSAETKAKAKQAEAYQDTRNRIDAVDTPSDADAARNWLRERLGHGDL